MKKALFLAASLLVLALLNHAVWRQESLRAGGETLLLELAPVDPRALIQGDYMALRYALEQPGETPPEGRDGMMVVSLDGDRVARFVRFHQDETLAPGEILLPYGNDQGRLHIAPDSFLFQDGHAALYRDAKYGVFKRAEGAAPVLIGLADAGHRLITPP